MAHSKTLRRLGTLALAAAVGTAAMGAGRCAGVPDLAGSLAVAGSLLASPAAAFGAADRLFRQEADGGPAEGGFRLGEGLVVSFLVSRCFSFG